MRTLLSIVLGTVLALAADAPKPDAKPSIEQLQARIEELEAQLEDAQISCQIALNPQVRAVRDKVAAATAKVKALNLKHGQIPSSDRNGSGDGEVKQITR